MKTEWDYSHLAQAYLQRPDYAESVVSWLLTQTNKSTLNICDVGAGTAHLTIPLALRGHYVTSVEPNDEMRKLGQQRTIGLPRVRWHEGVAEKTGQAKGAYDLVTFGSSFNVTDRTAALNETARILKPGGWFFCAWNHRNLNDPLQAAIEQTIRSFVPSYDYGTRREDQRAFLEQSGRFEVVLSCEGYVWHRQSRTQIVEAWRSHATLDRQSGGRFQEVIAAIDSLLKKQGTDEFSIPYVTRAWAGPLKV